MSTRTRLFSFLGLIGLVLMAAACKPQKVIGSERTFSVEVPRAAASESMDVTLEMNVPQGSFTLSGGAEGLLQGAITYNAADYEPQMTNGDGALLIKQTEPGPKSIVVNVQNDLINQWDLKLSDAPMNFDILLKNGNYSIEFTNSPPLQINTTVNAGVSMVDLMIDSGLPAHIIIGEHTDLLKISTRGNWNQTEDEYTTGAGSAALTITVNMSGGELTLNNKEKE